MSEEQKVDASEATDNAESWAASRHRTVVRDDTFSRCVADEVVPIALGRDIELSCLQFSPILNGVIEKGSFLQPDVDAISVEVARVRMAWGEAVTMAMVILQQGIALNRVRGHKVAESIKGWAVDAEELENGDDEDA